MYLAYVIRVVSVGWSEVEEDCTERALGTTARASLQRANTGLGVNTGVVFFLAFVKCFVLPRAPSLIISLDVYKAPSNEMCIIILFHTCM